MRSRKVRYALAGLSAVMLGHHVFAQEVAEQAPDQGSHIVITQEVLSSPEQERAFKEAHKRQIKLIIERGAFGAFLMDLDEPRRALACGKIADYLANASGSAADPRERAERLPEAWRLSQRVAPAREAALTALSQWERERFDILLGEAMTMQSLIPDPAYSQVEPDFTEGGFDYQFSSILAMRCHQSLDENGVPDVATPPSPGFIEANIRFRFRGMDYVESFKDTDLGDYAKQICTGGPLPDFTNAPLDQRGHEGMSLLDWAIECEDKPAFEALIAAGFDLDAKGLWENPPLVNNANEARLEFLRAMLDAGANPNAMGVNKTALAEAMSDLDAINSGGDTRAAFNLLRERGALLNFPSFDRSVWYEWGLHGRNNGWELILEHWDEFDSDPVELASLAEQVLKGDLEWLKRQKPQARKVKQLLIEQYGVCFPVGKTSEMAKDERGYRIQPDCPQRR